MINFEFIGNLTREPEVRMVNTAKGQRNVTTFSVAVNDKRDKERTTFIRVSVWDKLADICGQYLHKSSKVYIRATSVGAHAFTRQDNTTDATLECTASDVEFLTPKQGDADDAAFVKNSEPVAVPSVQTVDGKRDPMQVAMSHAMQAVDEELPF